MKYHYLISIMAFLVGETPLCAQSDKPVRQIFKGILYKAEGQTTWTDSRSPLWLNANRHGLSSIRHNNGYLRGALMRAVETDSLKKWKIGYGADIALAYDFTSTLIIQQLYADVQYKKIRLSIGSKERPMALKNNELSSGSQTFGINARPIPTLRIELPEYLNIDKGHWIGVKGHLEYGIMTDGRWKSEYVTNRYDKNVLYHSKAGYLKVGNEDKFPLTFEGGLEMACQFGGDVYRNTGDGKYTKISMPHGLKQFFEALYSGGSDPGEKNYANAGGNTVGSWVASLGYKFPQWKVRAYYDHFFEDHSQLFLEYGPWKDGLIGLEITLPSNRFVSSIVAERLYTKDQSGPIYHDHTPEISDQISATDNYYNHGFYNGWMHWGQPIGNPLYASPLYRNDGTLEITNNRFLAYHLGIKGRPLTELGYRLLYSYQEGWGTYAVPFPDKRYNTSLLAELQYAPQRIGHLSTNGWVVTAAFAMDRGQLLGNHNGFQLTLSKSGIFNH